MRIAMVLPMVALVRRPLRVATFLSPALEPLYRLLGERAAGAVGRDLEFAAPGGYDGFEPDHADVAFVCGPPLLARSDRFVAVAAPVLADPRSGGRPVYWSEVVVTADRPWRAFGDLRGATLAYNEPESFSGYHCVRGHLAALGETAAFFGATVEAGYHGAALAMVADGRADAAAVDVHVLALARHLGDPAAAAVRSVAVIGPAPVQPVVVSRAVPADERAAITAAVVSASDHPAVAASLLAGFVAVGPDHAEPLRPVLDAADAAGIDLRARTNRVDVRRGSWA
jgi:phosphonate transport system substrate-binding protein